MLDDDGALVHMLFTSQVEDVTQPALDRLDAAREMPLGSAGAALPGSGMPALTCRLTYPDACGAAGPGLAHASPA